MRSSAFVEGRLTIFPGMFVAGRVDRLSFSELAAAGADPHMGRARDPDRNRCGVLPSQKPSGEGHISAQLARRRARSAPRPARRATPFLAVKRVALGSTALGSGLSGAPAHPRRSPGAERPHQGARGRASRGRPARPPARTSTISACTPRMRRRTSGVRWCTSNRRRLSPSRTSSRSGRRWIRETRRSCLTCSPSRSARRWISRTAMACTTTCSR